MLAVRAPFTCISIIAFRGSSAQTSSILGIKRFSKTMFCRVSVFILAIVGVYAQPIDQSIESVNRVDRAAQIEDEDPSSTLTIQITDGPTTMKPGFLAWLLTPLAQSLINPQSLLQNGVTQLKETLNNLGFRTSENIKAKQLTISDNLLHAADVDEPEFDANRLEPTGPDSAWLQEKRSPFTDGGYRK
nr:PREDICTED: uncharacterized protein LOC105662566 [Megachile rotundata]